MLGKQISVYMLPADEAQFIGFLLTEKHVSFLRYFTHRPKIETLKPLAFSGKRHPDFS